MKNADYTIVVDADRDLVRVTLFGFFETDDIMQLARLLVLKQKDLRSAPNQHLTLVDIREMQIQSQDSVTAFQSVIANPLTKSRRMAFIVAQSLARMQVQRAAQSRAAAYFMDPFEAEQWLLDDTAAAA